MAKAYPASLIKCLWNELVLSFATLPEATWLEYVMYMSRKYRKQLRAVQRLQKYNGAVRFSKRKPVSLLKNLENTLELDRCFPAQDDVLAEESEISDNEAFFQR